MVARFGVTTLKRWLTEALPTGVSAYIEYHGCYHLLKHVIGRNNALQLVIFRPGDPTRTLTTPRNTTFTLDTPVFLSSGIVLSNYHPAELVGKFDPAHPDSLGFRQSDGYESDVLFDDAVHYY